MTITPGLDIAAFCRENRVRFVRKDRSRLMRLIALVMPAAFLTRFWTTIGRTIYYPTNVSSPLDRMGTWSKAPESIGVDGRVVPLPRSVIEHEFYHVLQFKRLWHLHSLLYLLGVPLPFGLAWYRWRCERVAYLHVLRHYKVNTEPVRADWSEMSHVEQTQLRHVLDKSTQQEESPIFVKLQPGVPPHISLPVEVVVSTLWRVYGWCWPRSWMRRWLWKELDR